MTRSTNSTPLSMRKIKFTAAYKRDFKKLSRSQYRGVLNGALKNEILARLIQDVPLPAKYRDHALTGSWRGYRECHVLPDLLLVYRFMGEAGEEESALVLARIGSHAELRLA